VLLETNVVAISWIGHFDVCLYAIREENADAPASHFQNGTGVMPVQMELGSTVPPCFGTGNLFL